MIDNAVAVTPGLRSTPPLLAEAGEARINRLLSGPLTAGFGNRSGTKRRETASNRCDMAEPVGHLTAIDPRF